MDAMRKIFDTIWNFLLVIGEARAEAVKAKVQYRGY